MKPLRNTPSSNHTILENQQGFSLIEIMIATGLIGIIALAFATMMDNQTKQLKYLESKQDIINVKNALIRSLGNDPACCLFANAAVGDLSFSTVSPIAPVTFQKFFRTCSGTPPASLLSLGGANPDLPTFNVQSMTIKNLSGNNDNYSGDVEINLVNKNSGQIEPKPISLAVTFKTQDTGPTTKQIVSCSTGAPVTNKLSIDCIDLSTQCASLQNTNTTCDSPTIPANYALTGGSCVTSSLNGTGRLLVESGPAPSQRQWRCRDKDHDSPAAGVLIAKVHACALNDPTLPQPTLDCVIGERTCSTFPNTNGSCTVDGSAYPGYTLVGGGCNAAANPSIGRLLVSSQPNINGTEWSCEDKDHSTSTGGFLIAKGVFCKIATGIAGTLSCKTTSNSVPSTGGSPTILSMEGPHGYTLMSVGCGTTNNVVGRLLTSISLSDSPAQSVLCANKDHGPSSGGMTTIYGIGCTF